MSSQTIYFDNPQSITTLQGNVSSLQTTTSNNTSQISSINSSLTNQGSQVGQLYYNTANPINLSVPWPLNIGNELYANAPSFQQTGGYTKYRASEGSLDDATRAKIYMGYLRRLICEEMCQDKAFRISPELGGATDGYIRKMNNHDEYHSYYPYLVYLLQKLQAVNINNIPADTEANRNLRADIIMTINYCTQLVHQCSPMSDITAWNGFGSNQGQAMLSSYMPGYYGYFAAGNAFFPASLFSISTLTGAYNYIPQLYAAATGMYKQYLDHVQGYNLGWRKHACQWSFTGWGQGDQSVALFDSYYQGASNGLLQAVINDCSDYLNLTYATENKAIAGSNPTRSYPNMNLNKDSSITTLNPAAATGAYLTGAYQQIVDNVLLPNLRQYMSYSMGLTGTIRATARTDNYPGRWACAPNDAIGDYCYTIDAARCTSYNPADPVWSLARLTTGANPNPQGINDVINNYIFFQDTSTGTNNVEKLYQVGVNFKGFFDELCQSYIISAGNSLTGADLATWNSFTGPNLARSQRALWLKEKYPLATDRQALGRDYGFCVSLTGYNGYTNYMGYTGTRGLIGSYGVYNASAQYGFTGPDGSFKIYTGTAGDFVDYRDQSLYVPAEISAFNATTGKPTYIYNKWNSAYTGTNINAAFGATGVNYGNMGAYGFQWINLQHNDLAGNLFLDTNIVKAVTASTTTTYDCFYSYWLEWFCKTYISVNLYANNGARLKQLVSDRCYNYILSIWKADLSGMAFCGGTYAGTANSTYITSGVLAGKVQCQFEVKYPPSSWADYKTCSQTLLHEFIIGHTIERAVGASRATALSAVSGFERTGMAPSSQGEGWATYCTMFLTQDAGFTQYFDPKTLVLQTGTVDNFKMLKNYLNDSRIAYRLLCDVGLNYSKYGWDWLTTCQTFLAGDMDAGKAAGWLARMPLYPGQALGYGVGCIALLAARRKCETAALASQSDPNPSNRWTFILQNFHDIILYANPSFTLAVLDEYANQFIANKGGLL